MTTLSDRDLGLMQVVLKNLTGDIGDLVNFENVAKEYGYKDKSNARTCFRRLIQKISGAEGAGAITKPTLKKRGFVAANDDEVEDGEVAAPKTAKKAKASPKKNASSKKAVLEQKDDAEIDIKQEQPESGEIDDYV